MKLFELCFLLRTYSYITSMFALNVKVNVHKFFKMFFQNIIENCIVCEVEIMKTSRVNQLNYTNNQYLLNNFNKLCTFYCRL